MATLDLNLLFPPAPDGARGPLPKQQEFMKLTLDPKGPKFVGYYGGYGSGKSLILCVTMITQGVMYGGDYVIAREFMPELRRTTMKLFLELLPKELLVEHRIADAEIHIKSAVGKPAVFYFVGLDAPEKLDSLTLSGGAIDEASQVSEEAFLKLQGRLRSPRGLRKLIIVGNPRGHDWAFRYLVKRDMFLTEEQKRQYRMIVAPSTENIHLPAGYVESMLASYSKERIQRDIMGSFDSFEGQIYNEFNRHVHVIKPFKIPEEWHKVAGLDHGFRNPACMLWGAQDNDGNLYIYREFYQSEWLIQEICRGNKKTGEPGLIELNGKDKLDQILFDPSIKRVQGQTGESDLDIYLENLPKRWPLLPANNDVTAGIEKVKQYLKINEKSQKPRLFIFETCHNLLDEITSYQYDSLGPNQQGKRNEKETPKKVNDHAVDAMRYMIMGRPELPKKEDIDKKAREQYGLSGSLRRELHEIKHPSAKDPFRDY